MKKIHLLIFACLMVCETISAQQKPISLIDSGYIYFNKHDFKKSAYFYDTYYLVQKHPQSNYDTYKAAVASSYIGNMDNARYYIKRSGEIFYDYSGFYEYPSYNAFVNDTLHNHLRDLPEWKNFITVLKFKADSAEQAILKITLALKDSSARSNLPVWDDLNWQRRAVKLSKSALIKEIKNFHNFLPVRKTDYWTLYNIKVNDTLTVPFLLYIPNKYQPSQKTPLYVYLHGAIINRKSFSNPAWIEKGSEIKIMDKVKAQNAFILYPFGRKDFGWLYQQTAFETILKEIRKIKSLYNIDDNKVFVGGHSNGGSGAYWFSVNQPNYFSAFFGLNYLPKVYSGNTSLRNMGNEKTFYGISGTVDPVFPFPLVNDLYQYARQNGASWKNYSRQGDHGLAIFKRDSINFIFDTLKNVTRNPFPKKIQWETDNIRNGRNAWLEISELDTLKENAIWQVPLNPTATQNGKTGKLDFNKNKSGAFIANANANKIEIQTSRVKKVKLYLSEDQFDFNEPLQIKINDKQIVTLRPAADRKTILGEFLRTRDRTLLISQVVEITIL